MKRKDIVRNKKRCKQNN